MRRRSSNDPSSITLGFLSNSQRNWGGRGGEEILDLWLDVSGQRQLGRLRKGEDQVGEQEGTAARARPVQILGGVASGLVVWGEPCTTAIRPIGWPGMLCASLGARVCSPLPDRRAHRMAGACPAVFTWCGAIFVYAPWKRFSGPHSIPTRLTVIAQASGPSQPPVNPPLGSPPLETRPTPFRASLAPELPRHTS